MSIPAAPHDVLAAFSALVYPTVILHQLPNALRLFAHLTLLAERIGTQAQEALDLNAKRAPGEQLDSEDVRALEDMVERSGRGLEMRHVSLEVRKVHMKRTASHKRTSLKYLGLMANSYFPLLGKNWRTQAAAHSMLFINCVTEADLGPLRVAAMELRSWLTLSAINGIVPDKLWPTALPNLAAYGKRMHALAQEVIADGDALTALFAECKRNAGDQGLRMAGQRRGSVDEPSVESVHRAARRSRSSSLGFGDVPTEL